MTSLTQGFVDVCWLLFLIYWIVTGVQVKRTVESESRRWGLAFGFAILAAVALVHWFPGAKELLDRPIWPSWVHLGYPADLLALAGLATLIWARTTLGRNWSGGVVLKEDHELVTSGPYAYVRHPIYTGLITLMLATVLSYDTYAMLAVFAILSIAFWYKSTVEEKFMSRHFPEKYPAYMKRTKALIPYLF